MSLLQDDPELPRDRYELHLRWWALLERLRRIASTCEAHYGLDPMLLDRIEDAISRSPGLGDSEELWEAAGDFIEAWLEALAAENENK